MADDVLSSSETKEESERCVIRDDDKDLTFLTLLQEACDSSSCQKQLALLTNCLSFLTTCKRSNVEYLMSHKQFIRHLVRAIDLTIVPAFQSKEYYSYEKADFSFYPELTYYVLSIIECIVSHIVTKSQESVRLSEVCEDFNETSSRDEVPECGNESKLEQISALHELLPKLVLLTGAHRNCPVWSSPELEALSTQVLNKLMIVFSCETPNELFSMNVCLNDASAVKPKDNQVTLLQASLSYCWKPLSKDSWHKNPFLCHSFHWIITQMKLPHLSDCIEQIMSVGLNFLEDHQTVNKVRGVTCLHHLIQNTSSEEMRWLNRAEVVYEKLKNQMYSKEAAVVERLLPCLFTVLKILESPPDLERHHFVLDALIRDTWGENLLALRQIYVNNLTVLVMQVGIYSVRHLKSLVKIIGDYLEVDDGLEMSARPGALKLLAAMIRVAWPRMQHHAGPILKMCLSFIADINGVKSEKAGDLQSDLTDQTVQCLVLLSEACPEVLPCVKTGLRAGMDSADSGSHLVNVLKKQLAKVESGKLVDF